MITLWTASWCPSCKVVGPLIEELVKDGVGEAEGGVSFAEVQLDSPTIGGLMMRYSVSLFPNLDLSGIAWEGEKAYLEGGGGNTGMSRFSPSGFLCCFYNLLMPSILTTVGTDYFNAHFDGV